MCSIADQVRGQSTSHVPILAPLAIGLTVWVCHLAAIPLDGCRSAPAVLLLGLPDHWLPKPALAPWCLPDVTVC